MIIGCRCFVPSPQRYAYRSSRTATQDAWNKILSKPDVDHTNLREAFPEIRSLPTFEFSEVHKVVVGIFPVEITTVLVGKWRSQVNFKDAWGRSPLHWAASRGDVKTVTALTLAGAEVDTQDRKDNSPLRCAIKGSSVEVLKLLLKAGAGTKLRGAGYAQPIHLAASTSLSHAQVLVSAGSSVTALEVRGGSARQHAAMGNRVHVGEYLISKGIDINSPDSIFHHSVLFAAISSQAYDFTAVPA